MSENNSGQTKQRLLTALVVSLVAIVGFQTWYVMDLRKQLDVIQGNSDAVAAVIAREDSAPSVTIDRKPDISQLAQRNLNAQLPPGQQDPAAAGTARPVEPPSVFDDDFFNRPFFGQGWNPHEEIARMQREMDRVFSNAFADIDNSPGFDRLFSNATSVPQMDLQEDDAKYTVIVNLPDADGKDVSVNLDGQQLTVKGEQEYKQQKKDAMGNVIYQQHRSGAFQRSITLPEPVEKSGMVTHVDDGGVLTITIPKVS